MAIGTVEIDAVDARVRELASRDVSEVSRRELLDLEAAVARLGRTVGALGSRLAGEIGRRSGPDAEGGSLARTEGHADPGKMVAKSRGGTVAGARRTIDAGDAFTPVLVPAPEPAADAPGCEPTDGSAPLDDATNPGPEGSGPRMVKREKYPKAAAAQVAGELSVDAAGLIVAGLNEVASRVTSGVLVELEQRLVVKAASLAAHEVRRLVARAIARVDQAGLEERERRHRADRFVSIKSDHTGMVTVIAKLDAVTAAPIVTAIEQIVTHGYRARKDQNPEDRDMRTVGQMRADALFEICRHALGCTDTDRSGIRTSVIVRIDEEALRSGAGVGSIDGVDAPVSVRSLRRIAADAGVIPMVLGGDAEVLDLGREVRLFTKAHRLALVERDGGCAKCHAPPEHCEAHHIDWWSHGGSSDLANGVMLCTRCHHDIHDHGWQVMVESGTVSFIPPPKVDRARAPRAGGLAAIDLPDLVSATSPPAPPNPGTAASAPSWVNVPVIDEDTRFHTDPDYRRELEALIASWNATYRPEDSLADLVLEHEMVPDGATADLRRGVGMSHTRSSVPTCARREPHGDVSRSGSLG